jgi:pimeloyl-ACP methyl ester carboxylesterase
MTAGRLIYIHGRGHNAPRSQVWRQGFEVGLSRAGYDIDREALKTLALPVKYAAYLNPGVTIDPPPPGASPREVTESDRAGLKSRNDGVEDRIGPGLPVGAKSRVLGRVSRHQGIIDQVLKQRFADVALYLEDADRRRRILSEVRQQLPDRGRAILIGHSLGSIIALDLLRDWPQDLTIDALLTIGSPAGLPQMREHLEECRDYLPADIINVWLNVFDSEDPITAGGGLRAVYGDLVVDHHVENGGVRDNHDVDRYLEHITPSVILGPLISDYLELPTERETELPDDEVQSAAWLDRSLRCRLRDELLERATDPAVKAARRLAREQLRVDTNRALNLAPATNLADHLAELAAGLPEVTRLKVLVELRANRPFAPFDVDAQDDELFGSLVAVAEALGWPPQQMQDVHHAVQHSSRTQSDSSRLGFALVGGVAVVAAAIATGGVGLAAAPGLAGAAAIASGLSGLGSLVGGSMAAGLFVTAGAGVATPGLAFAALKMLDPGQTLDEVVKIHAEALVHRWEDRPVEHDRIARDLERLLDEAQRAVRLHRSVETGPRASNSTKAWKEKAETLQRALDDLRKDEG